MLQFLVDVQLPNCSYRIPRLQTQFVLYGDVYLIRNKQIFIRYACGTQEFNIYYPITVLAISEGPGNRNNSVLYALSDTGQEYCDYDDLSDRGPECWRDYLIYPD